MNVPILEKSNRSREYENYSKEQHRAVVEAYLFQGLSHREIEKSALKIDSDYFRGFQSKNILNYLGLGNEFKGFFKNKSVDEAISILKKTNNPDYEDIIAILSGLEIYETQCKNDIEFENSSIFTVAREGKRKIVYTTQYERNPTLRKRAIQIHGTSCMACGFNFFEFYGQRGKNYIEVHHVIPLSEFKKEILVNPATDMIVVCANCHRMIHREKNNILTLEELKKIISENEKNFIL